MRHIFFFFCFYIFVLPVNNLLSILGRYFFLLNSRNFYYRFHCKNILVSVGE
jgi:hypothetical protein